jgi:hypothetical protein
LLWYYAAPDILPFCLFDHQCLKDTLDPVLQLCSDPVIICSHGCHSVKP